MTKNTYTYNYVDIINKNGKDIYNIKEKTLNISINKSKTNKLGLMLVGIGGNNGSTLVSTLITRKNNIEWNNKNGNNKLKLYGSIYEYGSINIGFKDNKPYSKLIKDLVDIRDPDDIIVSGWDICSDNLYESVLKNKILDYDLSSKLESTLKSIKPLKSVYYEDFVAKNQKERANNIIESKSKLYNLKQIKSDIISFKIKHNLDKVVIMWTASTERFNKGEWKNWYDLEKAIYDNDPEVSPSIIFAVAAIMTNCIFINGSPQNTLCPAVLDLARIKGTFVGGEDFKTGQTKLKSVLVDFLASSGIKPLSIVSYNHLGNNDGLNLSQNEQFESKEKTKRNIIDDVVEENPEIFDKNPDHCVVIKYVPAVGDSKRAMDEYYSELCMNGKNTLAIHNTCEDTLLAVPLMMDIVLFSEFFSRITFEVDNKEIPFSSNLSLLSLFFKAPVDDGYPIINSFFKQRYALENFIKSCIGLPINDFINFHNRIST